MRVVISGASGLVGGNCLRYFLAQGWETIGTHYSFPTPETCFYNTLAPEHPDNFNIRAFKPQVIIHCGALTHVDYCEQHPEESHEKTVQSTRHLVEVAKECAAKLVYISTDYVFDGLHGPYTEEAEVNPLSIYGKHKLEAENLVRTNLPESLILRITNVYGSEVRGKNFVARIIDQCVRQQTLNLRLPYDQFASPVNAFDLARALFLLLQDGHSGVFHMAGKEYCNRVELAATVLKHFPDAQYQLEAVSTKVLQQPAPRPLLGGFVKKKFAAFYPDFQFSSVDDFVRQQLHMRSNTN